MDPINPFGASLPLQQQQQQQQQQVAGHKQQQQQQPPPPPPPPHHHHNTLSHAHLQPQHHQMFQFHHNPAATLHHAPHLHHHHPHPYSTLHYQSASNNTSGSSASNQTTTTSATNTQTPQQQQRQLVGSPSPPSQQQQHQQPASMYFNHMQTSKSHANLQQQQQQQAYNMNSDYSSSTYHIYDQISDLIIIKQQRMERKRQLEQRRKVILLSLATTLLVATLLLLLVRSLWLSTSSASQQQQQQQASSPLDLSRNLWPPQLDPMTTGQRSPSTDWFDASKFVPPNQQPASCSGHGNLVFSELSGLQVCKCDFGFWGELCQFSELQANQPTGDLVKPNLFQQQQLLAKCLATTNCNNNGQCNQFGRCQCFPGFTGPQCEIRLALQRPEPTLVAPSNGQENNQQQPSNSGQIISEIQQQQQPSVAIDCATSCNPPKGQCNQATGQCRCSAGWFGDSCEQRDLCHEQTCTNNQGICLGQTGICQCKFGFKGQFCELRDDDKWQRLLNCSSHGKFDFVLRKCNCDFGFTGLDCSQGASGGAVAPPGVEVSSNINAAKLRAQKRCQQRQEVILEQQNDNNNNNNSGDELEEVELFDLAEDEEANEYCGPNGRFDCQLNRCLCKENYAGDLCQEQQCSGQCLRNGGQCLANGSCACRPGTFGRHCSFSACPNQCSERGQCVRQPTPAEGAGEWRCQCHSGATGDDCSQSIERQCDDGIDNDQDGLVDCADSECCADKVCQNSTMCMKSLDPIEILFKKNPPLPTWSFFQRMEFLIDKPSSQIHHQKKDFNDSRASVIRGRVLYQKQGVTGVRVSVVGQQTLGITLTRDGGYFDLMCHGGGVIQVDFRREPFKSHQKSVRVQWNEIVLVEPVELQLESTAVASPAPPAAAAAKQLQTAAAVPCLAHDYRLLRPQVSSSSTLTKVSPQVGRRAASPAASQANILSNSAAVQETVPLAGTNQTVALVYSSTRANEFMSTISIQLIPPTSRHFKLPDELKLVHLRVIVEGILFEQTFEPQSDLFFTYAWNRRNVYRQKSFGLSNGRVSVGYEYFDCQQIIWHTRQVKLLGHDLSISNVANQWNLNIHHRYNHQNSILQHGDGRNVYLRQDKSRLMAQTLMGDGYQRQLVCPYCDGAGANPLEQRLLKPESLVAAPDGSLYVGDFNLIRRIDPMGGQAQQQQPVERQVRTVLELPANRAPANYALAMNPIDQNLYMTDAERCQIHLVKQQQQQLDSLPMESTVTPLANSSQLDDGQAPAGLQPVVGSGEKCDDFARNCGDGQPARSAQLLGPRAIAFDLANRMYIADGPNVRMVDENQRIFTILGNYNQLEQRRQSPASSFACSQLAEPIPMHKFLPQAPLSLAIDPSDETLHLLDENVVYKITQDKRVQIVAGRPAHCPQTGAAAARATGFQLQAAQSIAFGLGGELYIGESERLLLVRPADNSIELVAGQQQTGAQVGHQQQQQQQESAASGEQQQSSSASGQKQRSSNYLIPPTGPAASKTRASEHKFGSLAAIAVDQLGNVILADRSNLRLVSIEFELPQLSPSGEYEIQSPDNPDELFVFNRHGAHVATRELNPMQLHHHPAAHHQHHGGASGGQFALAQHHARTQQAAASRHLGNKFTFTYDVNTPLGQLVAVTIPATGNRISIYRDGQHNVRMIETSFGGQCKLEVSPRHGHLHSISSSAANATTKIHFAYHNSDSSGLLRQSRDQTSGEMFDFTYDEFGRVTKLVYSSARLAEPIECRAKSRRSRKWPVTRTTATAAPSCAAFVLAE